VIEPMKKVTIACLADERQRTVAAMQRLGSLHVLPCVPPASDELDELIRQQEQLNRVLVICKSLRVELDPTDTDPERAIQDVNRIIAESKRIDEELALARNAYAQLEPWGSFDKAQLSALQEQGVHIALCASAATRLPELPDGAAIHMISETAAMAYFAVVSLTPLDDVNLPRVTLPDNTDRRAWEQQIHELVQKQQALEQQLRDIAAHATSAIESFGNVLQERIAFAKARDGMSGGETLAFISGYVPEKRLDELRTCVRQQGWAIRYEDIPEDDEDVPTLLTIPRRFSMAQTILDFVGILPGYREIDISIAVLIFLSLFCGMLVGDAGYGLLFTIILLVLRAKNTDAKKRDAINVLLCMSLCILGYGWLSGNWFAIPNEKLPRVLSGIAWLTEGGETAGNHVKLLCFFVGAFHLSLARAWRTFLSSNIRDALGHVGWGLFLWANFLLAKLLIVDGGALSDLGVLAKALYLVGFLLILSCGINWRNMGDVIYAPFSFINSFVDVLSYIRLFAVGMSSFYIANSFNDMTAGLYKLSPWLIPIGLLVLAGGHLLNVALAGMGVLVHGIRLNTLEFSGHMDVSWSGKPYRPLSKQELS
jgi:V/A-type H+-transporting ATPase subunit I